jgi:hypothetical protein
MSAPCTARPALALGIAKTVHQYARRGHDKLEAVRILVSALAVLPWAVAWIAVGARPALADSPWPVAIAAGVPAVVVLAWQRRQWVLFAVAFALAGVAGYAGGRARQILDLTGDDAAWPTYDLTAEPLPEALPEHVAIVGFYRAQWRLSEYAVPEGEIPNQSARADATLVPFVGSRDDVVTHGGPVVVARVPADAIVDGDEPITIRGKVEPLRDELLHTLVQVSSADARGIMLDTLQRPERRSVWTNLAIAAIVALLAFACLWFAITPDPGEGDRPH